MKEKVGLGLGPIKKSTFSAKTKNQGKGEKKPRDSLGSQSKRTLKELPLSRPRPRAKLSTSGTGQVVSLGLPKSALVTKLDLGLGLVEVTNEREEPSAVQPASELALWPADGILRQALMSFNYPDQDQDGINTKPPETITKDVESDGLDSSEKPLSPAPQSVPLESVLPADPGNKASSAISLLPVSAASNNLSSRVLCLPVPVSTLSPLTLTLASVPEVTVSSNTTSDTVSTPVENASSPLPKSPPFTTTPFTLSELTAITLAEDTLPLMKEVNTFCSMPITLSPSLDPKKISIGLPLNHPGFPLSALKTSRPILATVPSKEGMVTLVYSTIPTSESPVTFTHKNQCAPLPPMSDLKSNAKSRGSLLAREPPNDESQTQINVPLDHFVPSKMPMSTSTLAPLIGKNCMPVYTSSGVTMVESQSSTPTISHSVSHLMQPFHKTFPATGAGLNPRLPPLSVISNGDISITTASLMVTSSLSPVTTRNNSKRIKSIQDILNSQSNGTIYTTSLTSAPIMAIPSRPSVNNILNLSPVQSTPPPLTSRLITSAPTTNANAQLHALLNNTVSSSSANSGSPSLNALLNNAVATSNPSSESPSLHSLLNGTVRNPDVLPSSGTTTAVNTTPQNTSPFFSSSVSEASTSPSLSTQEAAIYTTSNSLDAAQYTIQSPAEILSQLKAGILPTMSSSQVSSVLSALASDPSCPMEIDNDSAHHEIMSGQVLHLPTTAVDKVSTLTQTDDLDISAPFAVDHQTKGNDDKHICLKNASDETMIAQVMNMLSREEEVPVILDVSPSRKHPAVASHLSQEAISPTALYIKQELLESSNSQRTSNFGKSIHNAIINIENYILGGDPGSGSPANELVPETPRTENRIRKVLSRHVVPEQKPRKVPGKTADANGLRRMQEVESAQVAGETDEPNLIEQVTCFKCKFCPYLSLEKEAISKHIVREHNMALPPAKRRRELRCPGCPNVFYSSTSLKVHLTQDHQVTECQLAFFVDTVVKFSESPKAVATKQRTGQSHDGGNPKTQLPSVDRAENSLPQIGKKESNGNVFQTDLSGQMMATDRLKIRVRNLDKETNSGSVRPNGLDNCQLESSFHNDSTTDDDSDSSGAVDMEQGEGSITLDDDSLTKKVIKSTVEPCEYKDVKENLPELLMCEEPLDEAPLPPCPKKRGRPRGSRNQPPSSHKKQPSEKDTSPEKNSGYKCDIDSCAVRLKSHDNIEYHRRCHHLAGYVCPECALDVLHWNSLISHLWRVHGIDMELYSCHQCSYKTNSYSKLANLHLLIHSEERPFLCDTCGKGFKNPKQLRNHKAIHIAKTKVKASGSSMGDCETCGRSFSSVRLLRLHQDNVHRKLRPYLCNFCGYSASSRSTLKMHMRQHTGEKPFGCDECSYVTADHNSLRRHKMRHSGDKPYKCPHCTYACIQSSTFKAHLKSKHPGLDTGLMFSCPLCSFRSVKKDNYLAHLAEHDVGLELVMPAAQHDEKSLAADAGAEKQHAKKLHDIDDGLSVVIDIASGETTHIISDASLVSNLQLVYESTQNPGTFVNVTPKHRRQRPSKQLGRSHHSQMASVTHALDADAIETGSRQMSDFEPEEITGDLGEISQISEHRELKFKVSQELQ